MAIGRSGEFAQSKSRIADRDPFCGRLMARLTETAPVVPVIARVVLLMARRRGMPGGRVWCGKPTWRCRLRRQDGARSLGGLRALDDRVDLAPIEPNAPAFDTVVDLNPLAV